MADHGRVRASRRAGLIDETESYQGEINMEKFKSLIVRLIQDEKGQDMVEYALLARFVAVASGAILPTVSQDISIIFSKMASVVTDASV